MEQNNISAHAYDVVSNESYVATEHMDESGLTNVKIIKLPSWHERDDHIVIGQCDTEANTLRLNVVIDLIRLADDNACCVCLDNGDIAVTGPTSEYLEVVGTVEDGIAAAKWSPDEELLVIVTKADSLLLMTRSFDMISETSLATDDLGEDQQVNVGWGKKETQFHGSEGKAAAVRQVRAPENNISPNDDKQIRISWRGDGNFFSVSTIDRSRRIIRVFNREASLQNTSETVEHLEHPLAWRPSGNLIASTQQLPHRHDVIFFERNGLRHGQFTLPESQNYVVKELAWNSDSNILAVWATSAGHSVLQLWTTGNYHWYLKQEFRLDSITCLSWHPEDSLLLSITTPTSIYQYELAWDTYLDADPSMETVGCAAVADGLSVLITPFKYTNVPPPLSTWKLSVPQVPRYIDVLPLDGGVYMTVLRGNGTDLDLYNMPPKGSRIAAPHLLMSLSIPEAHQAILLSATTLVAIGQKSIHVASLSGDGLRSIPVGDSPYRINRETGTTCIVQQHDGQLVRVDISGDVIDPFLQFPEFCPWFTAVHIQEKMEEDRQSVVGLSKSGNLYIEDQMLTANCLSYAVAAGYIVITTASHFLKFIKLHPDILSMTVPLDASVESGAQTVRAIERGGRVVSVIPSTNSVILQMPRGNLETIFPRVLVLASIRKAVDIKDYREAFLMCRKHRIDLNIIYDHAPNAFEDTVTDFVKQLDDVDYLNLFISSLKPANVNISLYGEGDATEDPAKVNRVCDLLRVALEQVDFNRYIQPILTTHVRKMPADYESALKLLLTLKDSNPELAEDALKYIVFLTDVNMLFDHALGMYDFTLVLMVAQQSQKDPREYLPFLRELEKLPKFRQRFRIDDHLSRRESALTNLAQADVFEETLAYAVTHNLYSQAIEIYAKDAIHLRLVYAAYGDHLAGQRQWQEAGLAYELAGEQLKATYAYEEALLWREALAMAALQNLPKRELYDLSMRLKDTLIARGRFADAAVILHEHLEDVEEAVAALAKGLEFTEAHRLAIRHQRLDLVETHIKPGVLEGLSAQQDDLNEMIEQLSKQLVRVEELRDKKKQDPNAFYGAPDDALDNVDVMTDTSTMQSMFTRYTSMHSQVSSVSGKSGKMSHRSSRRQQRKKEKGKKGSIYEEEYLLNSIKRLIDRLNILNEDIRKVLEALLRYGYTPRAKVHQALTQRLFSKLLENLNDIYDGQDEVAPAGVTRVEKPALKAFQAIAIL